MKKIDWPEEGKDAAISHLHEVETVVVEEFPDEPECPWPIYSPEGIQWLQGWNSIAVNWSDQLATRPPNHGNLFLAEADR